MSEKNQDWQQRIARSDGDEKIDSYERVVLNEMQKYMDRLPADRAEQLIKEMEGILSQKEIKKSLVIKECYDAIRKLKIEIANEIEEKRKAEPVVLTDAYTEKGLVKGSLGDKLTNIMDKRRLESEIEDSRESKDWKEHKILTYWSKKGHNVETIRSFEYGLRLDKIEDINSLGFSNYLIYLSEHENGKYFNLEYLRSIMGSEKLLKLWILWNINQSGNTEATLAQKILEREWKSGVKSAFSTILMEEMDAHNKARELEKLKQFKSFPKTEAFLKEKWINLTDEAIKQIVQSGNLTDIITKLCDKTTLKTGEDARLLFEALSDDASQKILKIESEQKELNIDENLAIENAVKNFALKKENFKEEVLKKTLKSATKEDLLLLLKEIRTSKAEQKEALEQWLEKQIEKTPYTKLEKGASDAKKSPQVQNAAVDLIQGKTTAEIFEGIAKTNTEIQDKKVKIIQEMVEAGIEMNQLIIRMGYTADILRNDPSARKKCLSELKKIKEPTPAHKRLARFIEQLEQNERRRLAFESGWVDGYKKEKANEAKKTEISEKVEPVAHKPTRGIPLDMIAQGKPYVYQRKESSLDPITISCSWGNIFAVELHNSIVKLPRENVRLYIGSLRFLDKIGLGYLTQCMSQQMLTNVLSSLSPSGWLIAINNQNGLREEEKLLILKKFWNLFGMDEIRTVEDGQKMLKHHFFTGKKSLESTLREKEILKGTTVNPRKLIEKLKEDNAQA